MRRNAFGTAAEWWLKNEWEPFCEEFHARQEQCANVARGTTPVTKQASYQNHILEVAEHQWPVAEPRDK